VDKAPLESYADVGGLEAQVQEIKEAVELPLTHPELYEDIGIKPPKARAWGPAPSLNPKSENSEPCAAVSAPLLGGSSGSLHAHGLPGPGVLT
jgi:hypothetical protein